MSLTQDRLHAVALEARKGLREALHMVSLHGGATTNSALNPPILLTTVATWERFIFDLLCAARQEKWTIQDAGKETKAMEPAPWLGSRADREKQAERAERHVLDRLLREYGVLQTDLSDHWRVRVATGWTGKRPTDWRTADLGAGPDDADESRELLRQALMGAKSARHAAAHRIYFKQAADAGPKVRAAEDGSETLDFTDWCYVWHSDNTDGGEHRRPTIQHGYVRGALALVVQLVNQTIRAVAEENNWQSSRSELPWGWFGKQFSGRPLDEEIVWGGAELVR